MNIISNADLYAAARAYSQKFANITPESYEDFQHQIAGMSTSDAKDLLNEFTGTALAFYLNKVQGVDAKNPWDINGLIEKFYVPFAGLKQNMYVKGRKPINPKFKSRVDGSSVDPFMFTKGSVEDIYYTFNDDYQNTISIPDFDIKTAVLSENGQSAIINGYMQYLASMYVEWEKEHIANVANEMLNSVAHPLNDTQVIELEFSNDIINSFDTFVASREELKNIVKTVKNVAKAEGLETTSAFNIAKFPKIVDKSNLLFICKAGLDTTLDTELMESAINKDTLNMDIERVVVPDFGGLVPTTDGTLTNKLYMKYDTQGRPLDEFTTDAEGTHDYTGDVVWYDPNEDVIGIIAEKGLLFIDDQNPYTVEGIRNPAGMYVTYWANKPNVGFHYDMYKNCVVIKKKITTIDAEPTKSTKMFGVNVSNIQSGLTVSDTAITGTSKLLTGSNAITDVWGEGNFIALDFTTNSDFDDVKVGLNPSEGSGLVSLDEDMSGLFKITNKDTQKFVIEGYKNSQKVYTREYDLSGLTLQV